MPQPKDLTITKKFNAVSKAGLGISKSGKYQFPFKFQMNNDFSDEYNQYGQLRPKIGDYCASALPSGMLSAGTVGKIIDENPNDPTHDGTYTIEFLDGRIEKDWRYGTGKLTETQAKEVHDYYVKKEKRPDRVKVNWWK